MRRAVIALGLIGSMFLAFGAKELLDGGRGRDVVEAFVIATLTLGAAFGIHHRYMRPRPEDERSP